MQAYGVVVSNMILGGKFGPYLSMISGDFTKFSKAMLRDLESGHENYMRSTGKKEGYWMAIYRKPSKGGGRKSTSGPSRGISGRGASGRRGMRR